MENSNFTRKAAKHFFRSTSLAVWRWIVICLELKLGPMSSIQQSSWWFSITKVNRSSSRICILQCSLWSSVSFDWLRWWPFYFLPPGTELWHQFLSTMEGKTKQMLAWRLASAAALWCQMPSVVLIPLSQSCGPHSGLPCVGAFNWGRMMGVVFDENLPAAEKFWIWSQSK